MKDIENFPSSSFDFLSTLGALTATELCRWDHWRERALIGSATRCVCVYRVCGVLCIFASRARIM